MITEKNHKLLTSQLFVTDCTKKGLASMLMKQDNITEMHIYVKYEIVSFMRRQFSSLKVYIEQRRQFSSGGSFRPLFIIAGFLNIESKASGKYA